MLVVTELQKFKIQKRCRLSQVLRCVFLERVSGLELIALLRTQEG